MSKNPNKRKVPDIRFPGFSDKWIIEDIENVCESIIDCVNKTATVVDYKTPYRMIRTTNVRDGRVDLSDVRNVTKETYIEWTRRGAPQVGDLIFTREAPVGEIGLLTDDKNVFLGQRTMMYRADKNLSLGLYLLYSMQTRNCRKEVDGFSNGGTVSHVRVPDCGKIKISHPSLPEQQNIASFLSDIDTKIEKLSRKKELLEQYKNGIMQKIFSREIRFKDENGEEFPEWEEKKLVELGTIIGGGTPPTGIIDYWNGKIDWYTPTEIGNKKYSKGSRRSITKDGLNNSSARLLPKGTVLITTRATIGDVSILSREGATNQGFHSIIPNQESSSEFVYYLIHTLKKDLLRRSSGSTFLEISKSEIAKIRVLLPSLPEQQKIIDLISSLDIKISQMGKEIYATKEFKKGLLQGMFV